MTTLAEERIDLVTKPPRIWAAGRVPSAKGGYGVSDQGNRFYIFATYPKQIAGYAIREDKDRNFSPIWAVDDEDTAEAIADALADYFEEDVEVSVGTVAEWPLSSRLRFDADLAERYQNRKPPHLTPTAIALAGWLPFEMTKYAIQLHEAARALDKPIPQTEFVQPGDSIEDYFHDNSELTPAKEPSCAIEDIASLIKHPERINNKIMADERTLYARVAEHVRTHPRVYRQAGAWLDTDFGRKAWEIGQAQNSKPHSENPPLTRWEYNRLNLIWRAWENILKDQPGRITQDLATRILLITWLLWDPDANCAKLGITEFEKWPWGPADFVKRRGYHLYRRYAALWWIHTRYAIWSQLVGEAYQRISRHLRLREVALADRNDAICVSSDAGNNCQEQVHPDGEWSKPESKSRFMAILGMDSVKKFNAWVKTVGIRQAGNRQLWQIRVDTLDPRTRKLIEKI